MPFTVTDDGFTAALDRYKARRQKELFARTDRLMNMPLINTIDPAMLAELEKRFVGGTFVLNTSTASIDIRAVEGCFIHVKDSPYYYSCFGDIPGATYSSGRPKLVVIYMGQYIDLSHLWV